VWLLLLPRLLGPAAAVAVAAAAFATVIATGVSYRNNQCRCDLFLLRLIKPLWGLLLSPALLQRHRLALQLVMRHG
jgi:hypothetical protein